MTKPNEFILNTDYLALAQTNRAEFTAVFPQETFNAGQAYTRTRDFICQATNGAIERVLISRNNKDYMVGSKLTISEQPTLWVSVYRLNKSTIRVRLHEYSSNSYTMPLQTIKIKITSFRPPNVF